MSNLTKIEENFGCYQVRQILRTDGQTDKHSNDFIYV